MSDEGAQRAIEAAWDAGIRYFDTAPLYGFGLSEQRLGAVLRTKPREEFVISTKVGRLLRAGAAAEPGQAWKGTPPVNPVFDFSYDATMRSVDESLNRLRLDRVDVLLIHDPDQHFEQALTGAYRALDRLRAEGTVRAIGAGMNQAEMLARFAREADFDCFLVATRCSIAAPRWSCCRCVSNAESRSSRAASSTAASSPSLGRTCTTTTSWRLRR